MIKGIGIDIIEIDRIKSALENPAFIKKVFTPSEMPFVCRSVQTAAGFFAAKEAVAKALGTGFTGFRPTDVEILEDAFGAPSVVLKNEAEIVAAQKGVLMIHITISHSKEYAVAMAIAEGGL